MKGFHLQKTHFCRIFLYFRLWGYYLFDEVGKTEIWIFSVFWKQEHGNMYQQVNKMLKPSSSASFLQNLREKELEPILRKQLVQAKVFIELDHLSKMKSWCLGLLERVLCEKVPENLEVFKAVLLLDCLFYFLLLKV